MRGCSQYTHTCEVNEGAGSVYRFIYALFFVGGPQPFRMIALSDHGMADGAAEVEAVSQEIGYKMEAELTSYQKQVEEWLEACFPPSVNTNRAERTHRFLEEALELAQANGCSRSDAISLVDYVFGRPKGDSSQEVGGVMVTLASLCSASGIHMDEAGAIELARNWERIETIRAKQQTKPHGSPLPQ